MGKEGDGVEEGGEGPGEAAFLGGGQAGCVNAPRCSLRYTGRHSPDNSHGTALFH